MPELHFLRPLWLLALPLGLWLVWRLLGGRGVRGGWLAVVDRQLQAHVLARPDAYGASRVPLVAGCAAVVVATLALAGPTWERLPVPAFRSDEALVVALDLSRSMDATDVEPSRLERAKLKLLSLLERRASGQTALVVFSAHAFTVTPLTTDTRTIGALVNSLSSEIMPSRGSYPESGLERAATLIEQTGLTRGEILLVTDAEPSSQTVDAVRELRGAGITTSVLAVGTPEGAPIPEREGGFLTDEAGQVVVPQLDVSALRRLADAGGGRFARLTGDDRDLDALFPRVEAVLNADLAEDAGEEYEADTWRDTGVWLAIALLPLLALGFRRGWVAAWLVCLALPAQRAHAFEWSDLWQRPDQRGYEAMQNEQPEVAAGVFENPEWRAAAEYRSGDFEASATTLAPLQSADASYNRGNALARSGELEAAIDAYDQALALAPQHEDAAYNRALVEDLLEQQQQEQQRQQQQQRQQDNQQSSAGEGEQQDPSQGQGEQNDGGSSAQQQRSADNRNGESEQSQDQSEQDADGEESDRQPDTEQAQDEREGANEEAQSPRQAAASAEDLEQWASDQAAEQWLRRIPQDPGGLLRRKFLYQYQRLGVDQDGNYVWPGDEAEPW